MECGHVNPTGYAMHNQSVEAKENEKKASKGFTSAKA